MNKPDSPNDLALNVYLMAAPFWSAFNNFTPNNPLMHKGQKPDYPKAFKQWLEIYRYMCSNGLVYVLPNDGTFQDQVYVANLGLVLHHCDSPTVLLSNFTSPPRKGEEKVGEVFFQQMKYAVHNCPYKFEGEADCKYITGNLYIGGYGIRTQIDTYKWMQNKFNCRVVPVEMNDPKLYHWDCLFFPIDENNAIVNTNALHDKDIKLIEKYINILDVPKTLKYTGITNLVRVNDTILCRDLIPYGKKWLTEVCFQLGYRVAYFPLEAFDVGGADASCLVMSLTRQNTKSKTSVVASVINFFRR